MLKNGKDRKSCQRGSYKGDLELSDGKILTTMEWLMVFAKVPLKSMVFQWFFYMWTIGVNGFSMVLFTCESLVSMVFQWFFWSQPLVSMIFPMVFNNRTIAIAWMVCGSPLASMVYQWFWGKWMLVHKKGQIAKKHDFFNKNKGVNKLKTD